jgi:hypothetical protein
MHTNSDGLGSVFISVHLWLKDRPFRNRSSTRIRANPEGAEGSRIRVNSRPFVVQIVRDTIRQERVFCARFPYVTRSRTRQPARTPVLPGRCKTTAAVPVCSPRSSGVAALTKRGLGAACLRR